MTDIFRQIYIAKDKNGTVIRKQRIANGKMLCIISILGIGLSLAGGCSHGEDEELERKRQQLLLERVKLLLDIPPIGVEDEWTAFQATRELDFWSSLNKKQRSALLKLWSALDGRGSQVALLKCVNKMVKLVTPGMLIQLAELTKAREDILQQKPVFFSRMEFYKGHATGYYNQLMWFARREQQEVYANWTQAESYYREAKSKVMRRKFEDQELLYDLRNALIATENIAEPEE
jgi:hypothetical protein